METTNATMIGNRMATAARPKTVARERCIGVACAGDAGNNCAPKVPKLCWMERAAVPAADDTAAPAVESNCGVLGACSAFSVSSSSVRVWAGRMAVRVRVAGAAAGCGLDGAGRFAGVEPARMVAGWPFTANATPIMVPSFTLAFRYPAIMRASPLPMHALTNSSPTCANEPAPVNVKVSPGFHAKCVKKASTVRLLPTSGIFPPGVMRSNAPVCDRAKAMAGPVCAMTTLSSLTTAHVSEPSLR